jgi:hypothetical protein
MRTVRLNIFTVAALAVALLCSGYLFGQRPEHDISGRRHPNLAAAQQLVDRAFQRIVQAQQANEWDLNGHAQKAKELLDQANHELKEAAESSNEHHEH